MNFNIKDLTIGQAQEISAMFSQPVTPIPNEKHNNLASDGQIVIAVLQRGHVAVGIYRQIGNIAMLQKASIIRRWGTADGLGELAIKGPLENTKLDKCPEITFHIREAIMVMHTGDNDAWRNYINKY